MGLALVTGASGGIGSAIAQRLASDGNEIVVGYNNNREMAERVCSGLEGTGHCALRVPMTQAAGLAEAKAAFAASFDHLDVLVNCAGMTKPVAHDDLEGLDDQLIDEIFAVNWRGPFATVRAFLPFLERSTNPVIVNISSVAAVTGQGSNVAYCASKAALDSMTRSLARALGPLIRVVSVSPGWVMGEYAARMPAEILDTQRQATPLGRLATADDVAAMVSAVVHNMPFTTGTAISVDGGRPLGTS